MRKANIENENKTNRKQQLEGNRDYTGRRKLKKKRTKTQTKTIFDILRQINAVTMKQRLEKVCKEQKDVLEIKNMLMMGKKNTIKYQKIKLKNLPVSRKTNMKRWKIG